MADSATAGRIAELLEPEFHRMLAERAFDPSAAEASKAALLVWLAAGDSYQCAADLGPW